MAKKEDTKTRWADYRVASRGGYGCELEVGGSVEPEDMTLGAVLRIADAMERAYPAPGADYDDRRREAQKSRRRAWHAYLLARGVVTEADNDSDSDDPYVGSFVLDIDDELICALQGPESVVEEGEYPHDCSNLYDLLEKTAWEMGHSVRLTPDQRATLRRAMAAKGLYLADEWPDSPTEQP